jgi:putative transposase
MMSMAVVTGLVFARFSKPTARILFNRIAVITPYDGVPTLMLHVANQRCSYILEAMALLVLDLFSGKVVGWPMSDIEDRHLVLGAVLMACWQRSTRDPVVLHSDRGTQFTSGEYQQFLTDHHITSNMSDVGHCGDNAPAEGSFGLIKRERIHRRRYPSRAAARSDVFDYIECLHNPRMQRRLDAQDQTFHALTQPFAKTG